MFRENIRNSNGISSGNTPRPSSATDIATQSSPREALTRIAEESGEYRAAFDSRLHTTWTIRRRSAITRGRSSSISIVTFLRPPPVKKMFFASSTKSPTATGPGVTDNMPVSMRATSSRSLIRSRIRSLWDLMMRMNCTISAESRELKDSSRVSTEP